MYLQKAMGLSVKQNIFRTWGILFGQRGAAGDVIGFLFHQLIAAVAAIIPSLNPDTGNLRGQGFAYKNYGALDVITSLVGHLAFGTLTGILYGYLHSGGGSALAF